MEQFEPVYYSDYLELDKILEAQHPKSDEYNVRADDEMLFIIIHQSYELWFKQILHEVKIIGEVFSKPAINDNSPDLYNAVHRLKRIGRILEVLVHKVTILETMTPLDFLDFRNMLRPASGFQSYQFKILEALLGLRFDQRFGQNYYLTQLRPDDLARVKSVEGKTTLVQMVNNWLERMPYFEDDKFWANYKSVADERPTKWAFWNDYREVYKKSLSPHESGNLNHMDSLLFNEGYDAERSFSQKANRSMLFIMLYRGYPMLQLPYELLNSLLDIDDLMAQWRSRHMNMVHRMIGGRTGTGGSTGKEYLKGALDKHYIFKEVADMTSFLIERRNLPVLGKDLDKALGYAS